jgi:hypothetical protein
MNPFRYDHFTPHNESKFIPFLIHIFLNCNMVRPKSQIRFQILRLQASDSYSGDPEFKSRNTIIVYPVGFNGLPQSARLTLEEYLIQETNLLPIPHSKIMPLITESEILTSQITYAVNKHMPRFGINFMLFQNS